MLCGVTQSWLHLSEHPPHKLEVGGIGCVIVTGGVIRSTHAQVVSSVTVSIGRECAPRLKVRANVASIQQRATSRSYAQPKAALPCQGSRLVPSALPCYVYLLFVTTFVPPGDVVGPTNGVHLSALSSSSLYSSRLLSCGICDGTKGLVLASQSVLPPLPSGD